MPKAVFTKATFKRAWEAAKEAGIEHPRVLITAEGIEVSAGTPAPPPDRRMKLYDAEEDGDGFEAWSRAKGL